MSVAQICIIIGGLLSLFMAVFHSRFYKMFYWRREFRKIGLPNQRILYTIHIALLLFFLVFAILSFVYVDELSQPQGLAFGIAGLYALFWLWRTIWQVAYFRSPKGSDIKKMPFIHYFLILIFALLFIVYGIPVALRIVG
jgi:hypothetical protein